MRVVGRLRRWPVAAGHMTLLRIEVLFMGPCPVVVERDVERSLTVRMARSSKAFETTRYTFEPSVTSKLFASGSA